MNILTTHYFKPAGTRWSGNRVLAIDWETAEYIASLNGEEVTGKLVMEDEFDNDFNIDWTSVTNFD